MRLQYQIVLVYGYQMFVSHGYSNTARIRKNIQASYLLSLNKVPQCYQYCKVFSIRYKATQRCFLIVINLAYVCISLSHSQPCDKNLDPKIITATQDELPLNLIILCIDYIIPLGRYNITIYIIFFSGCAIACKIIKSQHSFEKVVRFRNTKFIIDTGHQA